MNIKIFSVFHKPFPKPFTGYIIPVQAGKTIAPNKMDIQGDDTGMHISETNTRYSELTVLYWVWKNFSAAEFDAWGLCHYRRYFMTYPKGLFAAKKSLYSFTPEQKNFDALSNNVLYDEIGNLLTNYDAIIQLPMYVHKKKCKIKTIEENYFDHHSAENWRIMKDVIKEKFPEYTPSLDLFCDSHQLSFFNMMIAKWPVWNSYLGWLFEVLHETDKRMVLPADVYQQRTAGFMAERLMTLFLQHNKIHTTYLPVAVFDKTEK